MCFWLMWMKDNNSQNALVKNVFRGSKIWNFQIFLYCVCNVINEILKTDYEIKYISISQY